MFLTTVIPIARGISKETLTYISQERVRIGSLIEIPLRKKMVKAIVTETTDARKEKMSIRSSGFRLRKIDNASEKEFLSDWAMRIIKTMADHYATTVGAMLFAVLGKNILESEFGQSAKEKTSGSGGIQAIEGRFNFRAKKYKKAIQENMKAGENTLILFPTLDSVAHFQDYLKKDLAENLLVFHSKITRKKFQKNLEKLQTPKSLAILTTGSFLFLIPPNTKTLIIEEENSRWYKMRNRPFVDFSKIAKAISRELSIDLLLGDSLLRTETANENLKLEKDKPDVLRTKIIYSKPPETGTNQSYEPLGPEIEKEIKKSLSKKLNVFIWVPRKGYAPIVTCLHCGATVKCRKCDAPVVLHKDKTVGDDPYFLCHHCGEKRSALEQCSACGSWKLQSFGIGVERVEEEVNKKFGDAFKQSLIEIGTEKAINDLTGKYDLVVIPSIDSLLSLPDFNIDERLLRTILILKEKTKRLIIIKTKYKGLSLLTYIKKENLEKFHQDKIQKRKKFGYAPFKTLIKITFQGKKERVARDVTLVKKNLEKWKPTVFPAFIKTVNNQFIFHLLLKIDPKSWPESNLLEYLRSLPPWISINVDPESLL